MQESILCVHGTSTHQVTVMIFSFGQTFTRANVGYADSVEAGFQKLGRNRRLKLTLFKSDLTAHMVGKMSAPRECTNTNGSK